MTRVIALLALMATALFIAPSGAVAQDDFQSPYSNRARDWTRGQIQVTNDWRDTVNVTMWTHQREQIGDSWEIESGETAFLAVDGERIKVRPNYKIKVGNDWGWVNLDRVGQFRRGIWYVNVRDIWRATHQRDRYDRGRDNVPDWQR